MKNHDTLRDEASQAADATPPQSPDRKIARETAKEFIARLKDPARWKSALFDLGLWFVFGVLFTKILAQAVPGYPIVVGTPSIPMGLYWLDKTARYFYRNDLITFPFNPQQEWLKGRYGEELVHTKIVLGIEGDTVYADSELNLKICRSPEESAHTPSCVPAGKVQLHDSKGRELHSWVPALHEYTLKQGEIWVYSPHPKSLDSRYHGPIHKSIAHGRASALWLIPE